VRAVFDERIEDDRTVVGPVMTGECAALGDFDAAVAQHHSDIICFKVIAENLVTVAEDAQALRVSKRVSIDDAVVAMAQRELGRGTIDERVESIGVSTGAARDQLVLATAPRE
jgi:hypothetical protein